MRVHDPSIPGIVKFKPMRRSPPEVRPPLHRQRQSAAKRPAELVRVSHRGNKPPITPGNWQKISGMFSGRDVVIVGAGGSLCGFKFERLAETSAAVIVINNAIMELPNPDLMVSADVSTKRSAAYQEALGKGVKDWAKPSFPLLCCWPATEPDGNITVCRQASSPTPDPGDKLFCPLSGAGAITAAKWGGAGKIYLLGIDNVRFGADHLQQWLSVVRGSDWYNQEEVSATEARLSRGKMAVHYFSAERGHPADGSQGKYTAHHRAYEKIKNWKMDVVNLSPIAAVPQFPLAAVSELDKLILK